MRLLTALNWFQPFGASLLRIEGSGTNGDRPQSVTSDIQIQGSLPPSRSSAVVLYEGVDSSAPDHDEEVFVDGSCVVWSASGVIRKRLSVDSPVIQAEWCRLSAAASLGPQLCLLQSCSLTTYTPCGEMHTMPLPSPGMTIWPTSAGLLLQTNSEGLHMGNQLYLLVHPLQELIMVDWTMKEAPGAAAHTPAASAQLNPPAAPTPSSTTSQLPDKPPNIDVTSASTVIPERVLWSARDQPYVVTFNADTSRHALWEVQRRAPPLPQSRGTLSARPAWVLHQLWVEPEEAECAASEVALSHDVHGEVLLGLLAPQLQETRALAVSGPPGPGVRFKLVAVKAVGIVATRRSQSASGGTCLLDLLVLLPSGHLMLYVGQHAICRLGLPTLPRPLDASQSLGPGRADPTTPGLVRSQLDAHTPVSAAPISPNPLNPLELPMPLQSVLGWSQPPGDDETLSGPSLEVVGLEHQVGARVNVVLKGGASLRCSARLAPSSPLAGAALEMLRARLPSAAFCALHTRLMQEALLGAGGVEQEWDRFSACLLEWVQGRDLGSATDPAAPSDSATNVLAAAQSAKPQLRPSESAWEALLRSKMHQRYMKEGHFPALGRKSYSSGNNNPALPGDPALRIATAEAALHNLALSALHTLYEDFKLSVLQWRALRPLAELLTTLAFLLGAPNHIDHYLRDYGDLAVPEQGGSPGPGATRKGALVPDMQRALLGTLQGKVVYCESADGLGEEPCSSNELPTSLAPCMPRLVAEGHPRAGQSCRLMRFYRCLVGKGAEEQGDAPVVLQARARRLVLLMVDTGFGLVDLDNVPCGLALPLREALSLCRASPPPDWSKAAYTLIGREDLAAAAIMPQEVPPQDSVKNEAWPTLEDGASCAASVLPYAQHMRPISSSTTTHSTQEGQAGASTGGGGSAPGGAGEQTLDGMEHMDVGSRQMRFGRDLRLKEIRSLLTSAISVTVRLPDSPEVSDPEMIGQMQAHLWHLAARTTALSFGRGAFTLSTSHLLLTEPVPIPKLVLSGRVPQQSNATISLDMSSEGGAEIKTWPDFHNGAAAGLRVAESQARLTRTWIVFNRPKQPSHSHAGFLMALGLLGHLEVLAPPDVYRYLTQEHDATTVGVLLGMAAARRGTMDATVSKMLFLHIPTRHPPSFPELELPSAVQAAALLGVGLLYMGSAHRLMSEILLAEIGRKPGPLVVHDREGYALAAGLALGLLTLGKGRAAAGLADLQLEDRLHHFMVGGGDPEHPSAQMPFSGTHASKFFSPRAPGAPRSQGRDDNGGGGSHQVMEGTMVNLDVTSPGATLALCLMFLKTNDQAVASRLVIPDTQFALDYVRPDFILLRLAARSLVMWDSIRPSAAWVEEQLPPLLRGALGVVTSEDAARHLRGVGGAAAHDGVDDVDLEALAQANANALAGACLAVGLRYAGSSNADAAELVEHYCLQFIDMKRKVTTGATRAPKVDRPTLETCLDVCALALSIIMAGTGHLGTLRLLRKLSRRTDSSPGGLTYGNHMAISMAIGFLFLGGGKRTFSTSNEAIAALLIAIFPRFPATTSDNRCHLQVFRHLYVLATEARCVNAVDVDTWQSVYVPLQITVRGDAAHSQGTFQRITPCLLPEATSLMQVKIQSPRYWAQDIQGSALQALLKSGTLYVKRKLGALPYAQDPIGSRSLLSRAFHARGGAAATLTATTQGWEVPAVSKQTFDLVHAFSADPSILGFAETFCGTTDDFGSFCRSALYECITHEKPTMLQTHVFLYTSLQAIREAASSIHQQSNRDEKDGSAATSHPAIHTPTGAPSSVALWNLKLTLAYYNLPADSVPRVLKNPLLNTQFTSALGMAIDESLDGLGFCQPTASTAKAPCAGALQKYIRTGKVSTACLTGDPDVPAQLLGAFLDYHDIPRPSTLHTAQARLSQDSEVTDESTAMILAKRLLRLAAILKGTPPQALLRVAQCC